jgi:hypothetical protein
MAGIQAAYYSPVRKSLHETDWRSYRDSLINVADLYYLPQKQAISTPGIADEQLMFAHELTRPTDEFFIHEVFNCRGKGDGHVPVPLSLPLFPPYEVLATARRCPASAIKHPSATSDRSAVSKRSNGGSAKNTN